MAKYRGRAALNPPDAITIGQNILKINRKNGTAKDNIGYAFFS